MLITIMTTAAATPPSTTFRVLMAMVMVSFVVPRVSVFRVRLLRHAVLLDLPVQRSLADAEHLGGAPAIPARLLEGSLDHAALDLRHLGPWLNRDHVRRRLGLARRERRDGAARSGLNRVRLHFTDEARIALAP